MRGTIVCPALLALLLALLCGAAQGGSPPEAGQPWPGLELPAPPLARDRQTLGLGARESFRLADLPRKVWIVEVVGVYCQFCYEQLPAYNKLARRLDKAGLANRVGMLALAAGGTPAEVLALQEGPKAYAFPVVADESYDLHKTLGEPKTPFTVVIGPDGRVAWTHLGVVQDLDQLLALVKGLAK